MSRFESNGSEIAAYKRRAIIDRDIQDFLDSGGKVEVIPIRRSEGVDPEVLSLKLKRKQEAYQHHLDGKKTGDIARIYRMPIKTIKAWIAEMSDGDQEDNSG